MVVCTDLCDDTSNTSKFIRQDMVDCDSLRGIALNNVALLSLKSFSKQYASVFRLFALNDG